MQVTVGFQNSATVPDLGFYAARSYSLMRPGGWASSSPARLPADARPCFHFR